MVAEVSLRAAVLLHVDPAWFIRLGRVSEARKRYRAAASAYESAIATCTQSTQGQRHLAHAHYRQGRLHAHLKEWEVAGQSFNEALRIRPDVATWHAHYGEIHESLKDFSAAVDCYQRAISLEPGKSDWRVRLVRVHTKSGRPDKALETGLAGSREAPNSAALASSLTEAYEAVGDWHATAEHLRQLVSRRPADYSLRVRLVECLEHIYFVPFTFDPRGGITAPSGDQQNAESALTEAVEHLRQLTATMPRRPGATHRLGLLHERSGQLNLAADAYRLAMERLAAIDSWWCHRAAHEWAFRLAYVNERLNPSSSPQKRLRRWVAPAAPPSKQPTDIPGFFDAVMYRHGLQISGFLRHDVADVVDIYIDDRLLKRVSVDSTAWRPQHRYDLTHGLMNDFPQKSRLTLRANGRNLLTVGGADAVDLTVDQGSGKVNDKLDKGIAPTKKGTWPRTGTRLADRQERYLHVYQRAKQLLDEQGMKLWLCYGTLLGCYREGQFIPGDDDFDVSYVSVARDAAAFRKECLDVAFKLLQRGLDVNLSINGRLYKVGVDGVWIDITPMWFFRGRAWAFDSHDVTVDAIEPVRQADFLGQKVYIPRDSPAFLEDTYGPDWRIPQPQFRYYRNQEDNKVLAQMWAKPSEVRRFAQRVAAERERNPEAGKFFGVGYPGYPGFSWLTSPDGEQAPAA
jgi:tetratricopeptide (TPR) repeat protein